METQNWNGHGQEPRLQDMLNDPIVELVMARDNLNADDILKVVQEAKSHHTTEAA